MASSSNQFVHLHVHSQYSLLDGACRTAALVSRAKALGQSAVAITDHGCLFGVIDFYQKAVDQGIKPIIGIEAYMAAGSRRDRTSTGVKDGGYHLLLLAENLTGYQNLLKLGSIAYTEGYYYKPRIDKEVLQAHREGLIATSACLGGEIPSALLADNRKRAKEIAQQYLEVFGANHFFIELQKHIREQDQVNPELMDLADRLGIGTVATNDVHFLMADDHAPHDALCCIATGKLLSDESRMKYPTQLYLRSGEEMYAAMDHPKWQAACENTLTIAARCNVELNFKANHAPVVKIQRTDDASRLRLRADTGKDQDSGTPDAGAKPQAAMGSTEWFTDFCSQFQLKPFDEHHDRDLTKGQLKAACDSALRELTEAGAIWRYGKDGITEVYRQRIERELKVLADKSISAYFLIVWDFVNEAHRRGIPANARGSGVATMVGYCLGMSNACPVRYGLLFERFTDPDRSEYPDIDIDICQDGRQEIIEYVRQKYGHVAQIITFGSLKARAALRDVGRVLNVPLPEVDKICKLVGDGLGTTIGQALKQEPDLQQLYRDNPVHRQMIDTAQRIEGLSRHAGVHAAGVIVATQPLDNIVPLAISRQGERDQVITQWDGPTCEKVGLLKMDFLGLRTLSIIERAKQLIRATLAPEAIGSTVSANPKSEIRNPKSDSDPLDLDRLTYDDQQVLDLFRRGETAGVFQFESGGMRNLLVAMKPDRLEDLIAANALFRPGPMDLIPDYCDRKHGRKQVPAAHPIVEEFTRETHGIMVYQEQVMQIVHGLGGIPLRAAYTLIKNISKKKQKDIDAVRPTFVQGAEEKGLTRKEADDLFELILKFAGYGFNKSHSTGYAIIAYQTAYLKTYFPVQYMAAVLTYESVSTEKVVEYCDECRRVLRPNGVRGVEVKAPDINLSDVAFTVVFDKGEPPEPHDPNHGHIRFGLSAVKGVGDKAIGAIIDARKKEGPFKSLYDFAERVPLGSVNRATIDALIKCGAFDSVHGQDQRAAMIEALDSAIAAGQRAAADRDSGQLNMFGLAGASPSDKSEIRSPKSEITLSRTAPWSGHDQLAFEKGVLGFYLSSHPLDQHRDTIRRFANANCGDVDRLAAEVEVVLGGMLTRVRNTVVKNGKSAGSKMAMITIEDHTGPIEGVVFSDAYATFKDLIVQDAMVFLRGRIDRKRERPSVVVNQVYRIDEAAAQLTQAVKIVLRDDSPLPRGEGGQGFARPGEGSHGVAQLTNEHSVTRDDLMRLKELLRVAATGNGNRRATVVLEVHQAEQVIQLRLNNARIAVESDFPQRVARVLHHESDQPCCELQGPPRLLGRATANVLHNDSAPRQRLERQSASAPEEFCASIDRY
ncbi:MAG: DNA polymerase III subunit alpha [Phycisphaeraceae bacterium]